MDRFKQHMEYKAHEENAKDMVKELGVLRTEIERLRKLEHDVNACTNDPDKGASAIAQNNRLAKERVWNLSEIERLRKEKEWLISGWAGTRHIYSRGSVTIEEEENEIIRIMQQALKEGE